jgi:hypothetical protein
MSEPSPIMVGHEMWLHSPELGGWTGWVPGEPGNWWLTEDDFERSYPEVTRAERASGAASPG